MVGSVEQVQLLLDLGRAQDAEPVVRGLLVDEPDDARLLRLLGQTLSELDRPTEALAVVDRAIAADPDDEHGHRLRSIVLLDLRRWEDAVRSATEAVRLEPYLWQSHYSLGMALRSGDRPRTRAALHCANEAVRLAPHESAAHNLAGMCLDELTLVDDARRAYAEALRLDPTNAAAMNNLAGLHAETGKLRRAVKMLTSGLSADPQQLSLHQNYDMILLLLVRRLYLALFGLGAVLLVLAATEAPYPSRVGTVVALAAAYGFATWQVARHLPRGSRLWARGLFARSSTGRRIFLATFALLTVAVIVMGLAPGNLALNTGIGMLVVLRFVGIGFFVAWIVRGIGQALGSLRRRDDG